MLGALALGDIGVHFPPTDDKWKGANSIELLNHVYSLVRSHGYTLVNADITIVLQSPRLAEHIFSMREKLAKMLATSINDISVKATTEEKLGFTGDGSGVSATAVVLLAEKNLQS